MKWERDSKDGWIAQGRLGHFLLWKDGRIWKGLYMHEIGRVVRFRFMARTIKEAKRICEENYHWEGTKV